MLADDVEVWGNQVEAVVWIALAVLFLVQTFRVIAPQRFSYALLATTLFFFGLSDVVESHTGACWRPWWLLLWKGTCVLCMVYAFSIYFRQRSSPTVRAELTE